ncbi:hypothetical protein SAMN05444920_13641 [Nonomuraea solani]|uniref:Uncharacterized protein n=1 Tax=Nonomuraea solani TaxID=1144553 RepID=A0A1H6F2H2_9ACTN|nr:hypothetical protein [Nonomuraea solani]SEH03409.1 hypothetical protein SAMN05444920_13641 [Nonomuraea solani]
MAVLHPRRVAWEGARIFVFAANTDAYWWLSDTVGHYLGLMYQLQLCETRLRLQADADALYGEAGAWRARLDDLLDAHPGAASILTQLTAETASRLPWASS